MRKTDARVTKGQEKKGFDFVGGGGEHKGDKAWQSNREEKRVKEAIFYLNKKPGIRMS